MGGWGCWFPNKVQNSSKSPRKSPLFTRISPFVFPNLTKALGWVGCFKNLGNFSQIKPLFVLVPSLSWRDFLFVNSLKDFRLNYQWPRRLVRPIIFCVGLMDWEAGGQNDFCNQLISIQHCQLSLSSSSCIQRVECGQWFLPDCQFEDRGYQWPAMPSHDFKQNVMSKKITLLALKA